jgi:hypothetical protein
VFYVLAALLVGFGLGRVVLLGLPRSQAGSPDGATPKRLRQRRYHVIWGSVWTMMGLYLAASAAGLIRLRLPWR